MKKLSLGFLIALITFTCGTFAAKILSFADNQTPQFTIEKIDSIQVSTQTLPSETNLKSPLDTNKELFNGWYMIEKHKYKGMPEVEMISIIRDHFDIDENISDKPISYAGVFTKFEDYGDQGFIDSATVEIDQNHVEFKTNKIKGIEYRFSGSFFKNKTGDFDGEKVLHGTLQKFVKGKKIAEVSGDFEYYKPHCWH